MGLRAAGATPAQERRGRGASGAGRPAGPIICLHGLTHAFGAHQVLKGIDLEVEAGTAVVILGGSGCGKTVLLKCLIGLLRPDRGQVLYRGRDLAALTDRELVGVRRHFGMLFQGAALFDSLTVAENVAFPLRQHTRLSAPDIAQVVARKLELVGLPGIEDKRPAELSGGMRKRVGLARAIALDPEVILYDEPTTGLDPIMADQINDLIIKMDETLGVTSFIVTHDIASAKKVGDRLLMMHDGRFIFDGTPAEIEASPLPLVRSFIRGDARMMDEALRRR
jgi:phospholipid/cholesterol/gamma-HCH transport system ATP-binding protein